MTHKQRFGHVNATNSCIKLVTQVEKLFKKQNSDFLLEVLGFSSTNCYPMYLVVHGTAPMPSMHSIYRLYLSARHLGR